MTYEKIRTISTTHSGDRFAVAEFEKRIQIWDLNLGLVRILDTDFDFGGKRLSISSSGKYLTIGSYDKNVVTTFSVDSGEILWTRKDLKKCGTIKYFGTAQEFVFVTLEKQATQVLSADKGETIEKIAGGKEYWENHLKQSSIVEKSDKIFLVDNEFKTIESRTKTTFAILDGCFSSDSFIATYSAGPLECLDLQTLKLKWTNKPNGHFLDVGFNGETNKVIGIRWDYMNGGPKSLSIINPDHGDIEQEIILGDIVEHSFLKQGKLLLTSTGQLISTTDGKKKKEFDFENS